MEANYVGPGWYWVEGTDMPLFLNCKSGRLTTMLYVENVGVRESTTSRGEPFKILAHIPRPAQRPVVDWSVMPAWAKWVAMDDDGNWHYFEKEPEIGGYMVGGNEWVGDYHNFPREYWPKYSGHWRNSLVERPE